MLVIDTKGYTEEIKIDSSEETSVLASIKKIKELGGAHLFILVLNGN